MYSVPSEEPKMGEQQQLSQNNTKLFFLNEYKYEIRRIFHIYKYEIISKIYKEPEKSGTSLIHSTYRKGKLYYLQGHMNPPKTLQII